MPKASELPDATTPLDGDEYLIVVQNGTTKKVAASDVGSPGGGAGTVPTGTGFVHVTGGAQDSAAKLVENADVHASAAIAVTKLATGTAGQFLTVVAGPANAYGNVVSHIQFVANGTSLLGQSGAIRVDPNNTRDIIVTRKEDDSGDLVLLSHWTPAAGKNELAIGNGQAIGTQVSRLVLSGADFVRALAGSYTAWRASSSGGIQFHSSTEDFGGGQGVIGIDNATTNPTTNPTAGIVLYVDSADNTLKYRKADGSTVSLSGGGGSVAGADTQVQFNDGGAFGADSGLTYAKATDILTVGTALKFGGTVSATGTVRLPDNCSINSITGGVDRPMLSHTGGAIVLGDASSIAGIIQRVNGSGLIYHQSNGINHLTINHQGVQVGSSTFSLGGGVTGVMGWANAGTVPTTNPTGGGVQYSEAGAGKWRGSGGTVTTFGPAEPHCPKCGTDVGISHAHNDLFGEELMHCRRCEKRTPGSGVVIDVANIFERRVA